ncbi:hypothetical protein ACIBF5_09690 [Micromonospora sp. NPDC050417]|uniref:hypothetical protein n=1 Tax=Micromonospora sp. NPDC050417 TaxID=3364280 RepID=UPI003793B1B0
MQSEPRSANPGTHAKVRVRRSRYLAAFAAIGCSSNLARSRETGLDPKSIYSALKGGGVGEQFMACTIAALRKEEYRSLLSEIGIEASLDSLFEVSVGD